MSKKRVLIVEDRPEFQETLTELLEDPELSWQIFSFLDGQGAQAFLNNNPTPIDIALIDIGLPDMSGVELIEQIHRLQPEVPILVISVFTQAEKVLSAIRAGAIGYLVKSDPVTLKHGIKQALDGQFPISPMVARHLIEALAEEPAAEAEHPLPNPLSRQEHRLLEHIAQGMSYAEIAGQMHLSLSTVQTYSRNLFRKLDVHSKTQALVKARDHGIIR